MVDVSVVIKSKLGEKTSTTTITNVNPEATNAQLYALGYKIATFVNASDNPIITKETSEVLLAGEE